MSEENTDPKKDQETPGTEEQKTTKAPATGKAQISKEKELEKQLRASQLEKEALELKLASLDKAPAVQESSEVMAVIEDLKKQLEIVQNTQKVSTGDITKARVKDGKTVYLSKDPSDLLGAKESVTFTARNVFKVIPGFMDPNGIEVIAPYGMILFKYAASDRRMDGKEEDIINFCSFTTRWKKEIEFLRSHPEYDVTFGENMNKVAGQNPREYQFRVRAAQEVNGMSIESALSYADQYKIPDYRRKSLVELRPIILDAMVKDYVEQEKNLNNDIFERISEQTLKHK